MQETEYINVYGARVHNLKDIDAEIPRNSLTVITGLSGSGKSSLAFDTIFAEGQRRYIETFSAYARNFLGNLERPDVDKITGLSPVISIEQKTTNKNPRSTVGTTTEIYDYLRLLYARAGIAYSYLSGEEMVTPQKLSTIKAALLLPFQEDKRMVEYYEGFLMAVDSLKRTGVSLDLYVYDSGKDISTLNTILAKNEMKSMNIIFGPMHQNQIKPLSDFAEKNDIRLVIPFSKKGEEVFNNPAVYQINTPQSYLYSEVYEHFTRQFPNAHVIFIESANSDKEKAEFISGLKQELKNKGKIGRAHV